MRFLGNTYTSDESKPLTIIDTRALNDVNPEKLKEHRLDVVLILLDIQAFGGGRKFTNGTFQMIVATITVFGGNTYLYDHFAIGFSCCDEFDKNLVE